MKLEQELHFFDRDPNFANLHALVLSPGRAILLRPNDQARNYHRVGLAQLYRLEGLESETKSSFTVGAPAELSSQIVELETAASAKLPWAEVTIV